MTKQFNISGFNGLYLTYEPGVTVDGSNYLTKLIKNTDFFPKTKADSTSLLYKNAFYEDTGVIKGSNKSGGNSALRHTEIIKPNELILNKSYYNKFTVYFNFNNSSMHGYTASGLTSTQFAQFSNRLRVKFYAQLGTNLIPLNLSNLLFYNPETDVFIPTTTYYSTGYSEGFRITTGVTGEPCIDLGYGTSATPPSEISVYGYPTYASLFNSYTAAPNGHNFKVNVAMPNFTSTALNGKDYALVAKYYNIAVSGTTYPFNTSETIEMMSNTYYWFEQILATDISYTVLEFEGGGGGLSP